MRRAAPNASLGGLAPVLFAALTLACGGGQRPAALDNTNEPRGREVARRDVTSTSHPPDVLTPGAPPTRALPDPATYPPLPPEGEALLVRARIGGASLVDRGAEHLNVSDDRHLLVVEGAPARLVVLGGRLVDDAAAASLGIDGPAVIVRFEQGAAAAGCEGSAPQYACVARIARIDRSASLPIDAGAALDQLVAELGPETDEGRALAARAAALADEETGPRGASRRQVGFAASWSERTATLEVLVVARQLLEHERVEANRDPHAGTIWCDAPPGADCAPDCVPPSWRIHETTLVEAGLRASFGRDGRRTALTDAGAGRAPAGPWRREPVGDCR